MIWRGASNIKPLKVNDSTFYVKEMNEKIQFLTNPSDLQEYMVLVPKEENNLVEYNFKKLASDEKVPSEYLLNDNYEKALNGYLDIKEKDSLDTAIDERAINSWGYKKLRENDHLTAINIFKINTALHPASSNVYDSLGQAFLKSGDTIQAIDNYKRSLALDSGNARAKRVLERLEKKD
jgi:tetratricopeptide (TPR) repeat protein